MQVKSAVHRQSHQGGWDDLGLERPKQKRTIMFPHAQIARLHTTQINTKHFETKQHSWETHFLRGLRVGFVFCARCAVETPPCLAHVLVSCQLFWQLAQSKKKTSKPAMTPTQVPKIKPNPAPAQPKTTRVSWEHESGVGLARVLSHDSERVAARLIRDLAA